MFDSKQFEKVIDRTKTWAIKWDPDYMRERFNRVDLLPFNHAEMDFECPQPIIDAIQERARHGIYGYTLVKDVHYQAIIEWFRTQHQFRLIREDLLYSTSVIHSLRAVIQFFTAPEEEVLIFTPIYKPLAAAVEENSRRLVPVALQREGRRYSIDFDLVEHTLKTHSIKLLILCNPHNPVGRVWTRQELQQLGNLCLTYHVLIVSDEIHCDIVSQSCVYTPIASVSPEIGQHSIVLTSVTKTFNLSGLKIATIIIQNPDLRRDFFRLLDKKFIHAPNVFGIVALQAAYQHCSPWVSLMRAYLDENYRFVQTYLHDHGMPIDLMDREGTPTIWLDFSRTGIAPQQIFKFLIDKARIIAYDGSDFLAPETGFQRLSLGYPRSLLTLGLDRIRLALDHSSQ